MNVAQRLEYVSLRLVRRFLFTEGFANRVARWLPYYATNANERHPMQVVEQYARNLAKENLSISDKHVLEAGAGRTNTVGYGLLHAGASEVTLLEPFVAFDMQRDRALRDSNPDIAGTVDGRLTRVASFDQIPTGSVDLLLSTSVLEHVRDLPAFFAGCLRVLKPDGVMLHRVDYRDHFFKYPYAFLTFSDATWSRWLDPGDLPRWRLDDHVCAMSACGFHVEILDSSSQIAAFEQIKSQVIPRFRTGRVDVTFAALLARQSPVRLNL